MQQSRGRAAVTAVGSVLAVLILVVLSSWAASIGPGGLFRGDGIHPQRDISLPTDTSPAATDTGEEDSLPPRDEQSDWRWVQILAIVVELVFLALGLYLIYRGGKWVHQTWQARRRPDPPPVEVEFDVLDDPRALVEELVRDAVRQRALLEEGSPRNGIVRCWHEFEVSAARAGLARKRWQTPAEFTMLVLDLVEAEHGAVARLADRYREARFSEHEVTQADRADALAALDQIHADLASRSGVIR